MSVLKFAISALVILGVIGVIGFFILGISSQNGSAPGLSDGRLAACPNSPNCVSSEDGVSADKAAAPFPLESWNRLPAAIVSIGGTVTITQDDYLAAEFKSATFGFVDDLELRKADDAVHVRSASRVGYSDAGANAARVANLRKALSD
ncbi:DUF1499 domain-containing protein [Erythrobacter insulae]|uniref:DUF1499 domain-containing protein n=1 Tax=Erythrobacter insulae TaxID=2584124 RepID=A0A547P9M2_9SPHN|nr:DUF1499 domain-containing protein [Erythrobacter insulae]TRD10852.1 DUF1499 domain-containing protein [Erythrobacter insulae]